MSQSTITYQTVREDVINLGGVMTVSMGLLRDAHGAGKLGILVRENISKELEKRGIRHWPDELPAYQHELVRLWVAGTPAAALIEAVLEVSEEADATIRDAVESDAAEILMRVRELVS